MNHLRSILIATTLAFILSDSGLAQSPERSDSCPDIGWLAGEWRGEIEGAGRIMLFRFEASEDRCITGDVGIPNHDVDRVPLSDIELFDDRIVHVHSDALGFVVKAQYLQGRLVGDFIQNDVIFDLELEPTDDA